MSDKTSPFVVEINCLQSLEANPTHSSRIAESPLHISIQIQTGQDTIPPIWWCTRCWNMASANVKFSASEPFEFSSSMNENSFSLSAV